MIKKTFLLFTIIVMAILTANAQYRLLYESFTVGGNGDTSHTETLVFDNCLKISSADPTEENPIPGIAQHITYIDYNRDTVLKMRNTTRVTALTTAMNTRWRKPRK